jgi:hypothetical protein
MLVVLGSGRGGGWCEGGLVLIWAYSLQSSPSLPAIYWRGKKKKLFFGDLEHGSSLNFV